MAFILRMVAMGLGSVLSLLWYRVLLGAMGDALYGLFLTFQAVTRLGGLGDLGISGALSLKAGLMMGRREDEKLRKLLASARALFLFLAVLVLLVLAALSPWLPQWLKFRDVPGAGSLTVLFIWGGVSGAVLVLAGYFHSLNYAHGTVTWPILPAVVVGQMFAPLLHWQLALWHAPLWVQNLPYIGASLLTGLLAWLMLKWSHPWLGELRPLGFDRALWKMLAGASGWIYLCSLGSAIYIATARLVINAGFGPSIIPSYQANYKACELAMTLIVSASFVSLPKITQWISSPDATDRRRLLLEVHRLNAFQIVLGCAGALGYLALNDLFVKFWLGARYQVPFALQLAFACNLAVTTGGDAGIQIAGRCGTNGIRTAGLVIAGTGILNLLLALVSMKLGSITGIAVAAVVAQSVLTLVLGYVTCRHLGLSMVRWSAKTWVIPLGVILAAGGLRFWLPDQSLGHMGVLGGTYVLLLLAICRLVGIDRQMLLAELAIVRAMFKPPARTDI